MLKFKKEIKQLGLASTTYGLPNFIKAKNLTSKLFWITFLIGSSVISCYFVYNSILLYNEYRVVTVIESIYEQPAQFPTISFCSYRDGSFGSVPLNQLIRECSFGYDYSCFKNPKNYFESFSIFYGLCYRFNSGKNNTNHSVPIYNSNIGGKDEAFALNIYAPDGLEIWIHNSSSPPKLDLYNNHNGDLLRASPGTITLIVIDKISDVKLGQPFNNCFKEVSDFSFNKTIIDYINRENETYSHNYCLELCFDLEYIRDNPCNCTEASLGNVWEQCWKIKENSSQERCTFLYKENFFKESILDKCSDYCPNNCDKVSFSVSVIPITVQNQINITSIKVYYRSLDYISIKQEPKMDLVDLVSTIGGIFGLFVGLSFVSIFEIIEIFIEIVLIIIK